MKIKTIDDQTCFNHAIREAVAVCPECNRLFCRECITEHEDRVLCASCLKKLVRPAMKKRLRFTGLLRFGQFLFGLFAIWIIFYYLAQILLSIPSSFHEGTIWESGRWFE